MKLTFALLAAFLTLTSNAQVSNAEMRGDFAEAAKLGRLQGAESLPTYASNNVKGTRYLTADWGTGTIVSKKGQRFENAKLMFDKQEQDVYLQTSANQVILINKDQISNFTIDNRNFIAGSELPAGEVGKYYELLAGKTNGFALLKQISTKFVKANRNDADRIKRGDFDDEYKDDITYYIKNGGQPLQKVKLTEKSISKALPNESKKIQDYMSAHFNDEANEQFYISLINYLN